MNTKDRLIENGGKHWIKGELERVYLDSKLFNEEMDKFGYLTRYSDRNNKFFYDCKKNMLMRSYKCGRPNVEIDYSNNIKETNEFIKLQKEAGLSNIEVAEYLNLNIATITRYRNCSLIPPKSVLLSLELKILEKK